MIANHFNIDPLLPLINRGDLIVTANNRLRNYVLRAYANHHADGKVVRKPSVVSLGDWIDNCWKKYQSANPSSFEYRVIDASQRQFLWEDVIRRSEISNALLQPEALASTADSAYRNLELWGLVDKYLSTLPSLSAGSDAALFGEWISAFAKIMLARGWITDESRICLMANNNSFLSSHKQNVHLLGFDDIPPLHSDFVKSASLTYSKISLPGIESSLVRIESASQEDEIRSAAIWSKDQLQHNPDSLIGIIVTNLGQCKDMVERVFTEVFEPLACLPEKSRYTLPFNFSAGTPLGSTPIISSTLDLLELNKREIELDVACSIIASPFWGGSSQDNNVSESLLRTHWADALRGLCKFAVTPTDLRVTCQKVSEALGVGPEINSLLKSLIQLESVRRETDSAQTAEKWSDYFYYHLKVIGWPGSRRLDSQEHQQLVLWNSAIDSFMQMDSLGKKMSYGSAMRSLRNIANKLPFQAKTPHSPIQILGVLEGGGLQFSHCWVLGLDHHQWPPVPAPNPLIPVEFQRIHFMPHASADRELAFAKGLTSHYATCAPTVVFSSSAADKEHSLSPSPLIRHIPQVSLNDIVSSLVTVYASNLIKIGGNYDGERLELVNTATAPVFDLSKEHIRGGASIFKDQASCPFNAFAKLRLGAIAKELPVPGFSAIERGNMLHEVLASTWRKLRTQSALLAMPTDELKDMIKRFSQVAVDRVHLRHREVGSYYAFLEKARLERMSLEWLEQEKLRPPFEVISVEEEVKVTFAGLPLHLRLDRIDRLENGSLLLIDYKTGSPKASSWEGERMDEPQLPLYAVTATTPINGIAFAQINAKSMKWIGTGELEINHDGISQGNMPWEDQIADWNKVLTNLADSFIAGEAVVDMKDATSARYSSYLEPLNRLPEVNAISEILSKKSQ